MAEDLAQLQRDHLEFATGPFRVEHYYGRLSYNKTSDSQRFLVATIMLYKQKKSPQHESLILTVIDRDTGHHYQFRIERRPDRGAHPSESSTSLPVASRDSLSTHSLQDASESSSVVSSRKVPAEDIIEWLPDGGFPRDNEHKIATLTFPNHTSPSSTSTVQLFDIIILANIVHQKFPYKFNKHNCYYMAGIIIDVFFGMHNEDAKLSQTPLPRMQQGCWCGLACTYDPTEPETITDINELTQLYKEAAAKFRSQISDREEAEAQRLRKEREMEERAEREQAERQQKKC
ncbi:hypothetical protein C0995_011401 [Termitomyces sp. Mi166|nr:hypothetical protein C0995_011401 [Termitomyces sp. Mi166\